MRRLLRRTFCAVSERSLAITRGRRTDASRSSGAQRVKCVGSARCEESTLYVATRTRIGAPMAIAATERSGSRVRFAPSTSAAKSSLFSAQVELASSAVGSTTQLDTGTPLDRKLSATSRIPALHLTLRWALRLAVSCVMWHAISVPQINRKIKNRGHSAHSWTVCWSVQREIQ